MNELKLRQDNYGKIMKMLQNYFCDSLGKKGCLVLEG